MSLSRYACCSESIGDPHAESCGGTRRYPKGLERDAADRHARMIGDSLMRSPDQIKGRP